MKNNDMFQSIFRMAKEYEKLVSPLTKQLEVYDRWKEITSPILRVAETHDSVLKGVAALDTSLARHLSQITEPYQPILNNMVAIESMMGTQFSELVRPQVYVPKISTGISNCTLVNTQFEQRVQNVNAVRGTVAFAEEMTKNLKPWRTDLGIVASFDAVIDNSSFSRLVDMEKTVASLSNVMAKYNQMTSVSAQIASLQKIDLTDAWKNAVTPPALILGLNDFAVKQYEQIKKATDDRSIAWRLGLIDMASKFVDTQVKWGTALAVEMEEEDPEAEMVVPDFSDLPIILGPAKRDNKDVEEAFDESQFAQITETGKIIIHKAKAVNDFCKARNRALIFPESNLVNWSMVLGGSFCRDADKLQEVLETLNEMFVRKPVTDLVGEHRCFEDIKVCLGTIERKKKWITGLQKKIYKRILDMEEKLIEELKGVEVSNLDEATVSQNIMKALLNVQKDILYKNKKENNLNDGIRNQLSMVYEVKDQTRNGESESGKDAGEVDIMLCDNGNPTVILEGLKLDSFKQDYLDDHINKALTKYNPNGCPLVYILIYATVKEFGVFWDKVMKRMSDCIFPYETEEKIRDIETAYADVRHAKAVLKRNEKRVSVHLYAVKMGK